MVTLEQLLGALRRSAWSIGLLALLGGLLGLYVGKVLPPVYTATAALVIDPTDADLVAVQADRGSGMGRPDASLIHTQIALITSRSHLQDVVFDLDLGRDPAFNRPAGSETEGWATGLIAALRDGLPDLIARSPLAVEPMPATGTPADGLPADSAADQGPLDATVDAMVGAEPAAKPGFLPTTFLPDSLKADITEVVARFFGASDPGDDAPIKQLVAGEVEPVDFALVEALHDRLGVWQLGDSYVIQIDASAGDPETAARLANGVADGFVRKQAESKRDAAGRAADQLERRVARLGELARQSEERAADFKARNGLLTTAGTSLGDRRIEASNQQLVAIRSEMIEKRAKLLSLRAFQELGAQARNVPAEVLDSARVAEARTREAVLLRERAALAEELGARHPQMVAVSVQLQEVRDEIRREIGQISNALQQQLDILASREAAIDRELEELGVGLVADRQMAIKAAQLEREADANRELHQSFLRRLKSVEEQQETTTSDMRIISRAVPPQAPATPPAHVFGLFGFTLAMAAGSAWAILRERFARRFRNVDEVEQALGVRVLAVLPRRRGRDGRKRVDHLFARNPMSAHAEAANSALTALQLTSGPGAGGAVVMITSALPAEGKSTTSLALAASAVSTGLRALIIDLDLRRSSLSRLVSAKAEVSGVAELVRAPQLDLLQLVRTDPLSGVAILTAGRERPKNPLELLRHPAGLERLLEQARRSYDLIVLDVPPVLAVADARLIGRLADSVVIVTRWLVTEMAAAEEAVRLLDDAGIEVTGALLNAVDVNRYRAYGRDGAAYFAEYSRYFKS